MPFDTKPLSENTLNAFTPEDIAWMAGILEGEGYFACLKSGLTVRLVMTDKDVVRRFADFWEVDVRELATRAEHHKPPFCVTLPSRKAAQCMRLILPYCGLRRSGVIRSSMQRYQQRQKVLADWRRHRMEKFSDIEFAELWKSRPIGETLRPFCQRIGLGNRAAAKRRLQRLHLVPGGDVAQPCPELPSVELLGAPSTVQAAWLAGLLEGEGSFSRIGGGSAVSLCMTDEDVVRTYATMVGTDAKYQAPRAAHFKPSWLAKVTGNRSAELMSRIQPYMGERRSAKIAECKLSRAAGQQRLRDIRAQYEAQFPEVELIERWTSRAAGETLSTFAREYKVHPQVMKGRLLELGIYEAPAFKGFPERCHTCEFCGAAFIRPGTFRGQFCSRVCSGRAQARRQAAKRKAALEAAVVG